MKHPKPEIQKKQEEFLQHCPESERDYHARMFRIGNATYRYHQLAASPNEETLKVYYQEWLNGLPDNISTDMKKKGFEYCKTVFPFTRYVNERSDVGIDEWMKEHLSPEDFEFLQQQGGELA